jgi:hypothetical protein
LRNAVFRGVTALNNETLKALGDKEKGVMELLPGPINNNIRCEKEKKGYIYVYIYIYYMT